MFPGDLLHLHPACIVIHGGIASGDLQHRVLVAEGFADGVTIFGDVGDDRGLGSALHGADLGVPQGLHLFFRSHAVHRRNEIGDAQKHCRLAAGGVELRPLDFLDDGGRHTGFRIVAARNIGVQPLAQLLHVADGKRRALDAELGLQRIAIFHDVEFERLFGAAIVEMVADLGIPQIADFSVSRVVVVFHRLFDLADELIDAFHEDRCFCFSFCGEHAAAP